MSMYDAIRNFSSQLAWKPEVKNAAKLKKYEYAIVCGMGGSHLAADLLPLVEPGLAVFVHHGYGLPALPLSILKKSLVIASSYSGNTEETLDSYDEARRRKIPVAAIATGGALFEKALLDKVPLVVMPNTGIQPRSALGFSLKALLALLGRKKSLAAIEKLSAGFSAHALEHRGAELAKKLEGFVPVVYSSEADFPLAYIWKIKFNETGKIPAFCNSFSELNHNEMTGFDVKARTKKLSEKFAFILLEDEADSDRMKKRMRILAKLYEDRGLAVIPVRLEGASAFEKVFSAIILADWTAYYTAEQYGVESEQVPMVEEFKKLVA